MLSIFDRYIMNIGKFKENVLIAYKNKDTNAKLTSTLPSMLYSIRSLINFKLSPKFKTIIDHQLVYEDWQQGRQIFIGVYDGKLSVQIKSSKEHTIIDLEELTEESYFQLSTVQTVDDFTFEDLMYIKDTFLKMQEDFKEYLLQQQALEIQRIQEFQKSIKDILETSHDFLNQYKGKL